MHKKKDLTSFYAKKQQWLNLRNVYNEKKREWKEN
jgi:hypothetical protein